MGAKPFFGSIPPQKSPLRQEGEELNSSPLNNMRGARVGGDTLLDAGPINFRAYYSPLPIIPINFRAYYSKGGSPTILTPSFVSGPGWAREKGRLRIIGLHAQ